MEIFISSVLSFGAIVSFLAAKALNAGLHVFVEKPVAKTVSQAQEIVALAKEKNNLVN